MTKEKPDACLNCEFALEESDRFCSRCGQKISPPRVTLPNLLGDFFSQQFAIEGRLFQTLAKLLFAPGHLTLDYWQGKRARYFTPIQIYLVASVIFFLVVDMVATLRNQSFMEAPDVTAQVEKLGIEKFDLSLGFRQIQLNKEQFIEFIETEPTQLAEFFSRHGHELDESALFYARVAHVISQPGGMKRFVFKYFTAFSQTVIVLMPVFGLIMYGLYWRKSETSVKCVVFSAHLHAFAFVIMIVTLLSSLLWSSSFLPVFMILLVAIYFVWAQKVVFGGSLWAVLFKSFLSLVLYSVSVMLLVILLLPIVFFTL